MTTFTDQRKLGLIVAVTLTISMLFVGISMTPQADQGESLELNQVQTLSLGVGAYAQLTLNGQSLSGDVFRTEIGGVDISADFIEFFSIRLDLIKADGRTGTGGRIGGRVNAGPLIFTKRLDQTSPLFAQGLFQNQVIEGDFMLFENNLNDGTERHRFTYKVVGGVILSIRTFTVQVISGGSIVIEEISLGYSTIGWVDEVHSIEYEYDYREGSA